MGELGNIIISYCLSIMFLSYEKPSEPIPIKFPVPNPGTFHFLCKFFRDEKSILCNLMQRNEP